MERVKRNSGIKVKPLRTVQVREVSHEIRDTLLKDKHFVDVCFLYEILEDIGDLTLHIVPEDELAVEATTNPDTGLITIREDIYDKAVDGDGHCRFTLAHELGHLYLHKGQMPEPTFARGKTEHETWMDSEWQADVYASELLMDSRIIEDINMCPKEAAKLFGLSEMAAGYKLSLLRKEKAKTEKSH